MRTLKFGGTSLSNAKNFLKVSNIIKKKAKYESIAIVLSAPAKITNLLEIIITKSIINENIDHLFYDLKNIFYTLINDIKYKNIHFSDQKMIINIDKKLSKIKNMIHGIQILKQCPNNIYAIIISIGEIISINIMNNILLCQNYKTIIINPIKNILATGNYLNAIVNINQSKLRIQNLKIPQNNIILMPGFIAGNENQELVILGRNGSDYSAAILSVCLNSNICEIWTDVDGIYTCDPRIVKNAKLLKYISYQEAMELSFLGAKVIHPKTIFPLSQFKIKCIIKNTLNPDKIGTIIKHHINDTNNNIIKGITYLNNIIMIQIKIIESINIYEITNKLLFLLNKKEISIILKTQSFIENKITIYLSNQKNQNFHKIFKNLFILELKNNILKSIKIVKNLNIISIIGSNIQNNKKIQKKIFSSLKYTNIKIITVTNQLSKNSISIITDNQNIEKNIKKIYKILFNNKKIVELFIIGIGGIGKTLIKQFIKQKIFLEQKNIKLKICSISNSKNMLINLSGIKLNQWKIDFKENSEKFCAQKIIKIAQNYKLINPVIIDCTASQEISDLYSEILSKNIHIITSNKKANTDNFEKYQNIRKVATKSKKKFLYETNVGAGLPVIQTLKNLFYSGDQLIHFRGILSGSLSYIFGKLEEGISLSESTKMAQKLGFTEPNPKDDLLGIDVARKLLIIAREAGYKLELKDIKIQSILPKDFFSIQDSKIFLSKLSELDIKFFNKIQEAKKNNQVLRFIGIIKKNGYCEIKLKKIDITDPLYNIKNGENALIIYSKYYQPIPLVLRGYGAGNNVTASGIFSDLLKILS